MKKVKKPEKTKSKRDPNKKSLNQMQFLQAALEIVIEDYENKRQLKSIQGVMDKVEEHYKFHSDLQSPCRDTMYKYFRECIKKKYIEGKNISLNRNVTFPDFLEYCIEKNELEGLKKLTTYKYIILFPDLATPIGIINVQDGVENRVVTYLHEYFKTLIMTTFCGKSGVLIFFQSSEKEKIFSDLVSPDNRCD